MVNLKCYHCQSENIVRNGKTNNGKQRYLWRGCGKNEPRSPPQYNGYSPEQREQILRAYQGTLQFARLDMPLQRIEKHRQRLAQGKKTNAGTIGNFGRAGRRTDFRTRWIMVVCPEKSSQAVDLDCLVQTRQVVACVIGDRSAAATCRKLWDKIPPEFHGGQLFSDFWRAYQLVLPQKQHTAVGKESGETAHVERWNRRAAATLGAIYS